MQLIMNICLPDRIQLKFPWYKRMHALMGTSPIVDRSAIANSATALDLSALENDESMGDNADSPKVC
jgi:hypothetical protein